MAAIYVVIETEIVRSEVWVTAIANSYMKTTYKMCIFVRTRRFTIDQVYDDFKLHAMHPQQASKELLDRFNKVSQPFIKTRGSQQEDEFIEF